MGGSGHAVIGVCNVEWNLPDKQIIDILIDPGTNIPLIHEFVCTSSEKENYGTQHVANAAVFLEQDVGSKHYHVDQYELKKSILCCASVVDETNQNLSGDHKELLHWHQKLCINIQDIQQLMKPHNARYQEGNIVTKRSHTIPTKYKSTADFSRDQYPMCLACKLATEKAKSTDVVTNKPISDI